MKKASEKVFFFHTPNPKTVNSNKPLNRYTIAGRLIGDCMQLAASKCSLRDQFSKRKGRIIAEGRLNSTKATTLTKWGTIVSIQLEEDNKGLGRGFVEAAINFLRELDPGWREVKVEKVPKSEPVF